MTGMENGIKEEKEIYPWDANVPGEAAVRRDVCVDEVLGVDADPALQQLSAGQACAHLLLRHLKKAADIKKKTCTKVQTMGYKHSPQTAQIGPAAGTAGPACG
jgi:hypothetical protein